MERDIGHRVTEARRKLGKQDLSALGSVPPRLCGNLQTIMAETTIKACKML
jgi:hypothetical protein